MKVCCCFGRSGPQDVEENDGKASVDIANVKNFENASTLPSCWSPPQQYNECSSNKSDTSSSFYQDTHPLPSSSSSANEESKRSSSKGERAIEGKTYIITDISKDTRVSNIEKKNVLASQIDMKNVGVFKKESQHEKSSSSLPQEGERRNRDHHPQDSSHSEEETVSKANITLRQRNEHSRDKEKRLKEWEKRLSQREAGFYAVHDGNVDRHTNRDSYVSKFEGKHLPEPSYDRKDAVKMVKDSRESYHEDYLHRTYKTVEKDGRHSDRSEKDEDYKERKRLLQTEREKVVREERRTHEVEKSIVYSEDQARLRGKEGKEECKGIYDKKNDKQSQYPRKDIEENLEVFLGKRNITEASSKVEKFDERLKTDERREKPRREEREKEILRREFEEQERLLRDVEHDKLIREEGVHQKPRTKEEEELERLRRYKIERERIKKEEEHEKKRKLKEEKGRVRRESGEKERSLLEEDREKVKKEDKEREKMIREKEEWLKMKRELEEKERLKKGDKEFEKLMRGEEELERQRKEMRELEKLKREEEERIKLKRKELEKLRREEEERERMKKEEEEKRRLRREIEMEKFRKEEEENERLRREVEEKERLKKEEEAREKLRKEKEERMKKIEEERLRKEVEERLRKEEEERIRREAEEKRKRDEGERLRKEEEERLRREKEEKIRREEEEKLKKEEEDKLRREEEERLRREEEERLKREREERLRRVEEERLRRLEEERLKREEEEKLRREEEERIRKKEEERLRRKEEERLRRENEEKLKREEEQRLRKEEEERLRKEEEERLWREEEERLRREEEERLMREEQERLMREEQEKLMREEQERLRREEQERLRREEQERLRREEQERLRREEQERLRREEQERLRREEQERLRREEQERLRREEQERLRREEQERLRREEQEILRREEQERLKREEQERVKREEQERLKREEQERLKREEQERLKREEEERLKREEEERLKREEEERLKREEEERLRRDEEEKFIREEERFRREEEECQLRTKEEEMRRLKEQEKTEESLQKKEYKEASLKNENYIENSDVIDESNREEKIIANKEKNAQEPSSISHKSAFEKRWQAKREELEEEERVRREKDRLEIEKTKRRIAELKKERDEIQRQQAIRLRMLMTGENDVEEKLAGYNEILSTSSKDDEIGSPAQNGEENLSPNKDFTTSTPESENLKIENIDSSYSEATIVKEAEAFEVNSTFLVNKSTSSTHLDEDSLEEVTYDHTVQSAQHKIEFCTGAYNESISKDVPNTSSTSNFEPFSSSTISSDFEPLPPPVPPHNVDPAILTANHLIEQTPLPPIPQQTLEVTTEMPEPMTPEEAEKLLSHNIIETKKSLITEVLEADSSRELNTSEVCDTKSDLPEDSVIRSKDDDDEGFDKDYDSVCVESPTPDNEVDLDDTFSIFKHEVNDEGFVVRAKEVLSEDGIHYLEDGHFWLQVPGLMEEDEDDIPDTVPFHQHTKIKFSQDPIKLYSTFSVTDYDRRNDEVDPVAASAEYELEKRVEKMNVFPVSIEKGDGGLGLSIIGMGVGADAGVEKLGIFVKTITPGGATDIDGRIKVNDQIIEVDNQSLVGVTQMFAASVLKNTSGIVNFLIGRENDPDNSEVAMLIRQSLMADQERDERRRALEGPNYDSRDAGGVFESFSSQSGGESPSDDGPRGSNFVRDLHREPNMYGQEYGDQFGDVYTSCQSLSPRGTSSPPPEAFNHDVEGRELLLQNNEIMIMSQHLQEIQHRNEMYEEEINILRNKISELEKELGSVSEMSKQLQEANARVKEAEDTLKSKQTEISTYQDMLEQSQGQYIILEKKYYKAKKIIKEYQSRERDFLHREEYHITQLEEKDALYNSLVKALKDRVIQLEGDLIKAQQEAGLPVKVPPDLNSQSSNFVHSSKGPDNHPSLQRDPPRKPSTLINCLDPDLSDTEAGDTHTSEGSKSSTVERKIPSKEELDVAVPPTELLDNSFSKAKGELASRGGLANRQLPSLKKSASNASSNSFDNSLDDGLDDTSSESQQQTQIASQSMISTKSTVSSMTQNESVVNISHSQTSISSFTASSQTSTQENVTYNSRSHPPPPYHSTTSQTPTHPPSPHHQPPPYQPPPSAPLSHRPVVSSDSHSSRSEGSYRHPPPVARVQPVNRVEALPSPTSPSSQQQHQQTLAHQLKALLAEREGNSEAVHDVNRGDGSPIKKSPSSLMEDVRRAVMQADISIGKKPVISGPIHVSSTAQVVSTGQFVHSRASPQKGVGAAIPQKVSRDSGTWSPVINSSSAGGVVLLSQRPIDSSLPLSQANEVGAGLEKKSGMASSDSNSSFDTPQQQDRVLSGRSSKDSSIMSVFDWNKEQVAQWLVLQGLENYVATFVNAGITGPRLVNIDTKDLKNLGLSSDDKNKIKRKVKELRQNLEKERKQIEKENKEREKLQKKAEKLAEKAERRKK